MENSEDIISCCNADSECSSCRYIPPALLKVVPEEFRRTKFDELRDGEDYSNNFLVGKVYQAFPISKRAKGYFRKLLLTEARAEEGEEKTEKKLNMFILSENGDQLVSLHKKSFVAVAAFKVENLTSASGDENSILPVQVLVVVQSDSNESSLLWVASITSQINDSSCSTCECMECDGDHSMQQDSDSESMSSDEHQQEHCEEEEENFYALVKEYSQRDKSLIDESDEIDIESDESLSLQNTLKNSTHQEVNEQANPVPESSHRCYTYTELNELKESITPDQNYNVYGIVVNCYFKPSSPDRDKILELILRDSTVDFFRCRVIGRCNDKFPDVYPGDIIRIHRMLVDKFRNTYKGKCFSPKFVIVFDGKTNDFDPRCVAKTFVFTQDDKKMVQNLRLLARKTQDVKLISELRMDEFVTVICQVVSVCMVRNETVLLKVWDGTRSPILMDDRTKTYMRGNLDERLFGVAKDYLVPIWINGDYTIAAAELKPGQYVKVCDVHLYAPKSKPDEPRLCIHPQTKSGRGIELVDPMDNLVQELKSRLQKIWEEAGVTEEITMGTTPSFMKDMDTSNVDCESNSDGVPMDNVVSENEAGTSVKDMHVQEERAASQPISAPSLASQPSLISTLNQGIEPVTSMQLASDSQQPVDNQLPSPENVERMAVDEGIYSPSVSRNVSPVKEGGKRANTDSDIDNATKKMKMDDSGTLRDPVSQNGIADQLPSQAVSPLYSGSNSSPLSSQRSQPNWWKSVETVSVSVGHQNIEPTYLDSVVKHFVPYKFRLFVTVLNIEPQSDTVTKLIRLYCPNCHYLSEDCKPDLEIYQIRKGIPLFLCAACSSEGSLEGDKSSKQVLEYTFVISLMLSDGTSTIEAYLWKKNAEVFFKGLKPVDVLSDDSKAALVSQMLWDICPNCSPSESAHGSSLASNNNSSYYPVLDCCLMSYTAAGKTRYQIFDTRLKRLK